MTVDEFREILKQRRIHPQLDFQGSLQDGVTLLLTRMIIAPSDPNLVVPFVHFTPSVDPRVLKETCEFSYLGETLLEVITEIENEYPIAFCLVENEEGGFEIYLEYYSRDFTIKEGKKRGRAHSRQRPADAVHR